MLQTPSVMGRMSSGSAHYGSKTMAAKESYCYRILKAHSVIVDFNGEPHLTNVPGVVDGETFKQWKERVLGPDATNVVVYYPDTPSPQTRMQTLKVKYSAEHVERMFRDFGRTKDLKKREAIGNAVEQAVSETKAKYSCIPLEILEHLLDKNAHLDPIVHDFLKHFINIGKNKTEGVDMERFLEELINRYNNAIKGIY